MLPDFLFPGVTVIRLGADRATKAGFIRQAGRPRCVRSVSIPFAAAMPGSAEWIARAGGAIQGLRREGEEAKPAVLVLPPSATLLKHLRLPRVAGRKRARLVAFEAGQNLPCGPDEVVWDSVLSGEGETTQDVLLVAAKLGLLEPLCAAAQASGFAVQGIAPEVLTVLAACRASVRVRREPELLLHIDNGAVTLLHLAGGDFAARSVQLGGLESAAVETAADRLASEVTRTLLHFQRQTGAPHPVRVLWSGGGPAGLDLGRALEPRLAIPVQPWDPGLITPAPKPASTPDLAWEMTVLSGAATVHAGPAPGTINLLPAGRRQQQRRRGRQPWLVAAGLLLLATPVGPGLHFLRLARETDARLAAIEAELAPWRSRESRNRGELDRLAERERHIAALQVLQDRRTVWLRLLADLQERLAGVEDVWFERMSVIPAAQGEPLKLVVAGRMLARSRPADASRPEEPGRVTALLASLKESPFVVALENERFDGSQPGMLDFEFVLVANQDRPL